MGFFNKMAAKIQTGMNGATSSQCAYRVAVQPPLRPLGPLSVRCTSPQASATHDYRRAARPIALRRRLSARRSRLSAGVRARRCRRTAATTAVWRPSRIVPATPATARLWRRAARCTSGPQCPRAAAAVGCGKMRKHLTVIELVAVLRYLCTNLQPAQMHVLEADGCRMCAPRLVPGGPTVCGTRAAGPIQRRSTAAAAAGIAVWRGAGRLRSVAAARCRPSRSASRPRTALRHVGLAVTVGRGAFHILAS